ncbi:hypothetical protein THAOC_17161, partial [Thalassiosira oceanica]
MVGNDSEMERKRFIGRCRGPPKVGAGTHSIAFRVPRGRAERPSREAEPRGRAKRPSREAEPSPDRLLSIAKPRLHLDDDDGRRRRRPSDSAVQRETVDSVLSTVASPRCVACSGRGDCWGDERPPPAGASADLRLPPAYIYLLLALHGDGTSMESRWNQHGIKMEPEWNHMEPEWNHMEPGEWNQDQNESHSDQNATQNATNKLRFELVQDLA